jgi:type I restriction enzyme S subunit
MAAVCERAGAITVAMTKPFGEVRKGFTYFAEGDVIFAKITPCMQNGKAAIAFHLVNGLGFGSTEFHVLRPKSATAEWLYFYVRSKRFRDEAERHFQGSAGQQRVPEQFMREAMIPDPSLEEQLRVVSRIKECLGRIEEMQRLREEAFKEIVMLGESILREAFAGNL